MMWMVKMYLRLIFFDLNTNIYIIFIKRLKKRKNIGIYYSMLKIKN